MSKDAKHKLLIKFQKGLIRELRKWLKDIQEGTKSPEQVKEEIREPFIKIAREIIQTYTLSVEEIPTEKVPENEGIVRNMFSFKNPTVETFFAAENRRGDKFTMTFVQDENEDFMVVLALLYGDNRIGLGLRANGSRAEKHIKSFILALDALGYFPHANCFFGWVDGTLMVFFIDPTTESVKKKEIVLHSATPEKWKNFVKQTLRELVYHFL